MPASIRCRPRLKAGVHGGLKEINARAFIQGNTVHILISPDTHVLMYVSSEGTDVLVIVM